MVESLKCVSDGSGNRSIGLCCLSSRCESSAHNFGDYSGVLPSLPRYCLCNLNLALNFGDYPELRSCKKPRAAGTQWKHVFRKDRRSRTETRVTPVHAHAIALEPLVAAVFQALVSGSSVRGIHRQALIAKGMFYTFDDYCFHNLASDSRATRIHALKQEPNRRICKAESLA